MARILIIHRGSLGDFLLLAPALVLLKKALPDCRIDALGRPEVLSLFSPALIQEAHLAERSAYLSLFENTGDLPSQTAEYIRQFDAALAFVKDPEGVLDSNLRRAGIQKVLVHSPFPPENERMHVAAYLHEAVASFLTQDFTDSPEIEMNNLPYVFSCTEQEIEWAEQFLRNTISSTKLPVAIHCGSGSERKCWPFERFEEFARRLSGEGRQLVFVLGPADERLTEHVHSLARQLNAPVADSLPLRRLTAVFSRCGAYIGNDSGVSHLAALTGIPTLAIFGPTDPNVWRPVGVNVHVVQSNAACSPCSRSDMQSCGRRVCLDTVSVQTVLEEAQRLAALEK